MTEGFFYKFGGFAPKLETSYERLMYEMRDKPDEDKHLKSLLNHESVVGNEEQVKKVFR